MVCIAAFIILSVVGVFVAFISIFKKDFGKKYFAVFKKAWHCVFKKVRLQKCDTNFKDDVKNTILKKVILKRPKLVKPLSVLIEFFSVLIVAITIWSIVISVKSLLALWVFGTCNVSKPSACSLTSESCSIDAEVPDNLFAKIGQSVGEWGEIFNAIPDRLRAWGADDFKELAHLPLLSPESVETDKVAYDILDPGCIACKNSFENQTSADFFTRYKTYLVVYPIQSSDGSPRFKNSVIAAKYLISTQLLGDETKSYAGSIINRIFLEQDEKGISWQTRLNNDLSEQEVIETFNVWLEEFGAEAETIQKINELVYSKAVETELDKNRSVVDHKIRAKTIPTLIYDQKKHSGAFKK